MLEVSLCYDPLTSLLFVGWGPGNSPASLALGYVDAGGSARVEWARQLQVELRQRN